MKDREQFFYFYASISFTYTAFSLIVFLHLKILWKRVVVWAHEMNFLFSRHCLKNSSLLFGLRVDVLLFFDRLKVSHIWLFWKYLFSFKIGLTGNTFCIITKLISSSNLLQILPYESSYFSILPRSFDYQVKSVR